MIKKIITCFVLNLCISLDLCSAGDTLVQDQEYNLEISLTSPSARIQKIMTSPEYLNNNFSNDYLDVFEADSEIVQKQIQVFFPSDPLRLNDFNDIHAYGQKLFANNATPSSKDVMFTYLAYADLLSQRLPHSQDKKTALDWRNPSEIFNILNSEEHRDKSYGSPFQHDYFFFPFLSKDGLMSLEDLNFCVAHKIVCVGIPYAKRLNAFDQEKNRSVLEFALHDVEHGNFYKYGPERLAIYNKMQINPNKIFEAVFFWVYHEDGYAGSNGPMSVNPIQNVLHTIDDSVGLYNSKSKKKSKKEFLSDQKAIIFMLNVFKPYDDTLNFSDKPSELNMKFAKNYLYKQFTAFEKEYYDLLPH